MEGAGEATALFCSTWVHRTPHFLSKERRRHTSFLTPRFSVETQDKLSMSGGFLLSYVSLRLVFFPSTDHRIFVFESDLMKSSA